MTQRCSEAVIRLPVQSRGSADQQKGRMAVRLTRTNWVASTAIILIAVQLVIRAILAFKGYFYWDDLILVGRAGTQDLFSPTYLFDDHDGHVMPGAFLVAGAITHLAPLNWIGPAVSLVVLQLLASLALLRALHVILGWRPVLLIPLSSPSSPHSAVPGFAWWAAALNSLPMLAAMAWVCADAILLVRTGNQRYAVTALSSFSVACSSSRSPPSFRSSRSRSPHFSPTSPETHPHSAPSGVAVSGSGPDRSH